MVDISDGVVFRNDLEARSSQIALRLQASGRFGRLQSYDYSVPGQLTVTCKETEGGRLFVFVLAEKTDEAFVDRELTKQLAAYDRGQ